MTSEEGDREPSYTFSQELLPIGKGIVQVLWRGVAEHQFVIRPACPKYFSFCKLRLAFRLPLPYDAITSKLN